MILGRSIGKKKSIFRWMSLKKIVMNGQDTGFGRRVWMRSVSDYEEK